MIATSGTIRKRSGKELKEEYDLQSHSMNYFLAEFCDYEEAGSNSDDVAIEVVYKAYEKYCETMNAAATNPQKFGFGVKRVCGGNVKSERQRSPADYKTLIRVYHGFRFDSERFATFLANSSQVQEDLRSEFKTAQLGTLGTNASSGHVPSNVPMYGGVRTRNVNEDSSKKSEPGQEEHTDIIPEEAKKDESQTNSESKETKSTIGPKFVGDQEYALDKAVISLREKDYPVNVNSIQTYLRANRTEMANHVVEKYMKVKNL